MSVTIRDAAEGDLPTILAIHNDAVINTTAIWSTATVDLANRREAVAARRARGFPYLVAEAEGVVAGYASYGDFRPFDGYTQTVEDLIYVHPLHHRRGIASRLLAALIDHATAAGKHMMVGGIAADNLASLALHQRHGFVETGRMPEVGYKFGRYLDLVLMQKVLG